MVYLLALLHFNVLIAAGFKAVCQYQLLQPLTKIGQCRLAAVVFKMVGIGWRRLRFAPSHFSMGMMGWPKNSSNKAGAPSEALNAGGELQVQSR